MSRRSLPNIIITGTPGCGKTSHSKQLQQELGSKYTHICISDLAKDKKFVDSYDEKLDTSVVNEDKLLDHLEPILEKGGIIIDWHVCDIFPERLIDLVVVLRTDNSVLFDRLTARGYKDNKIQENLDAEIMQVILQEAQDLYDANLVVVLSSNAKDEMGTNVERISQWVENWVDDHPKGVTNEYVKDSEDDTEEEDSDSEGDESFESDEE